MSVIPTPRRSSPTPARPVSERTGGDLCPNFASVEIIGTKWRLLVIRHLLQGPRRFNELLRGIPLLSAKTLRSTLRFLRRARVLERHVTDGNPVQVAYNLTSDGRALGNLIEEIRAWGGTPGAPPLGAERTGLRENSEGKALQ